MYKTVEIMKKMLFLAVVMLLSSALLAQTFVSTEPSNKNVILEEYTGINCGYCPDGHRIANQIMQLHPDRVWTINIHQGVFAANTYTTQWGNALANQAGVSSWPVGTINRHVFSGSSTLLSRDKWNSRASVIMGQSSPVNVAARAELDFDTRIMTIEVEAYYTANSAAPTNMLNVAILQNDIIGPQGGSAFNPTQQVGSLYRHMHMLRDLVTGQWGDVIDTTTQGTFVSRTYTYTVPQTISNEEMVLEDLEVIVFIAEGHQEIITGCEAELSFVNEQPRIVRLELNPTIDNCDIEFEASFELRNLSDETITSAEFDYVFNGSNNTYTWTGSIQPFARETIEFPIISTNCVSGTSYTFNVTLAGLNGSDFSGNSLSGTIKKEIHDVTGPFEFVLATDQFASETSFKIKSVDGSVFCQGGNFNDASSVIIRRYTINPEAGCYILEVYDSYGDGINNGYGSGYFLINNAEGDQLFRNSGKFGYIARYFLNVTTNGDGSVGIDGVADNNVKVYPNPVTDNLNISYNGEVSYVEIYDLVGRMVQRVEGNVSQVSTNSFVSGVYVVRVATENGIHVQKIVKE